MYDIIYKYPLYVNKGELVESSTDNINSASQTKMHCNAVHPNEPSGFHGHKATLVHRTMLQQWSQLVSNSNMSTDIRGH